MYLVLTRYDNVPHAVFTVNDPRPDGCTEEVIENVTLENPTENNTWLSGQARPQCVLGQDPACLTHYRVFKYNDDLRAAGFTLVDAQTLSYTSWTDYPARRPQAD